MVELKFRDFGSMNDVANALRKNGYEYSTFIIWKKDGVEIDCFAVRIEVAKNV